ncbi:hypothetical protein [Sphingobium cupriresistens]|uniref:Uncharacterized protein n=1 Tax=Sphingobium cupriresistens TaxID=1132417 RepID=A0A8G1ZCB2_9SPHN|nr:hypothetical protein [Sphingobium cupriresistens]RYM05715.1 hypothetical protein EWH12_20950 [Sphingobium cupriresistens]
MREPSLPIKLIGHPIVATPLALGCCVALFGCWQTGVDALMPAVVLLIALTWIAKISERANAYRAWKRAWDGMADSVPRHPSGWWRKPLGCILVLGVVAYLASEAQERPDYQLALGWMALVMIAASVVFLWRRYGRRVRGSARRRGANDDVVTVLAKPQSAMPTLDAAYHAMPDYCQQVLGNGR